LDVLLLLPLQQRANLEQACAAFRDAYGEESKYVGLTLSDATFGSEMTPIQVQLALSRYREVIVAIDVKRHAHNKLQLGNVDLALPRLKSVSLDLVQFMDDTVTHSLSQLTNLEELVLQHCTDARDWNRAFPAAELIRCLAAWRTTLRKLTIGCFTVDRLVMGQRDVLAAISACSELEELMLHLDDVPLGALLQLCSLTKLKSFRFPYGGRGGDVVEFAKRCVLLQHIELPGPLMTDAELIALSKHCASLTSLMTWRANQITDAGLDQFLRVVGGQLKVLDLSLCESLTTAMNGLEFCTSLTRIRLHRVAVDVRGLKKATNLRELRIEYCAEVRDDALGAV
jgi:hypothetical protein